MIKSYVQVLRFIIAFAVVCFSANCYSFKKISITEAEFNRWPYYCQNAAHTDVRPPPGWEKMELSEEDKKVMASVGIWHYCVALVKVIRAEAAINSPKAVEIIASMGNQQFSGLFYSYDKIDPNHPWAVDMAISIARAYRVVGDYDNSIEYLEKARALAPTNYFIYSVLSAVYFDMEMYGKSIEVLTKGNEVTNFSNPEINYFLGLAYAYAGDLKNAKIYAKIAKDLGYPLLGLENKIRRLERHQ